LNSDTAHRQNKQEVGTAKEISQKETQERQPKLGERVAPLQHALFDFFFRRYSSLSVLGRGEAKMRAGEWHIVVFFERKAVKKKKEGSQKRRHQKKLAT